MPSYRRFHLTVRRYGKDPIRTTLSLDPILADLLAVSLNETPRTRAAHTAVRDWMDKSLSEWPAFDPELPLSRQALTLALRRVADPHLVKVLDACDMGQGVG
jgi:hypothetical protein